MANSVPFLNNFGENATLLIVLALLYSRLDAHLEGQQRWVRALTNGVLFALAAIAAMVLPIHIADDISFDARAMIVMAASAFGGALGGALTAALVALWALHAGGIGELPTLGCTATAALIGMAFRAPSASDTSWRRRLAMGVVTALSALAWVWTLPAEIAQPLLHGITVPVLLYYPFAFMLFVAVVSYEQQQRERERALERSERRFRAIFNSTFQLTGLLAPDGRVLEANRTALGYGGLDGDAVVGQVLWETPWCPSDPAARRRLRAAIRRAAMGHVVRFEAPLGDAVIDLSLQPIRDQAGRVVMLLPEGSDVTERRAAEARLVEAEENLRQAQKMEAVGQLTGGIAHDFNNLLTVVGGNLELLMRRKLGTEEKRLIDAALRGVTRGATLTQQLLAFSRKQRLAPETVDVNAAVGEIATMLQRLLGDAIEVRTELADALRPGYFDPHQLETALLNLAINARDAMPKGGVLTITTEDAELPGERRPGAPEGGALPRPFILITVGDTGIGMDATVLRRAVEPFFTTKEVGRGSGLGLSMVYGFVTQSGGEVDITSTPGRGSIVRLYLPAVDAAPHQGPAEAGVHPVGAAARRELAEAALAAPLPAGSDGGERL